MKLKKFFFFFKADRDEATDRGILPKYNKVHETFEDHEDDLLRHNI